MVNYQRIKKDCFWDYDFTEKDIKKLSKSKNFKEQNFLFEKILLNSTELLQDLEIFPKSILKNLIENFKIPKFNQEYIFRRKNIAEVHFFNKPLLINELKWIA